MIDGDRRLLFSSNYPNWALGDPFDMIRDVPESMKRQVMVDNALAVYGDRLRRALMARHVVGRVDEIPAGGRKIVRLEGREVGIFNLEGTFYALKNSCPHQAARVCLGRVVGTALPSNVYEYRYGQEGRILRCPWHSWEYDITTGAVGLRSRRPRRDVSGGRA